MIRNTESIDLCEWEVLVREEEGGGLEDVPFVSSREKSCRT